MSLLVPPKLFIPAKPAIIPARGDALDELHAMFGVFTPFAKVVPGTYTLDANANVANGTASWIVPRHNQLVIELWGGGGGGAYATAASDAPGTAGLASTIAALSLSAGGGDGGSHTTPGNAAGGVASGGDINTNGIIGDNGTNFGPGAPNGGGNVVGAGLNAVPPGSIPGGGGPPLVGNAAAHNTGGSGAYVKKTYAKGVIAVGTSLALVAGRAGTGFVYNSQPQGNHGGRGRVKIVWT